MPLDAESVFIRPNGGRSDFSAMAAETARCAR
jgi:hypothetical protein